MGGPKAALLFGGDANPFAEPLNDRYVREGDVSNRRIADVANRSLGRLSWVDTRPMGVASGTTAVRAVAVASLRVQNRLPT
jgi:hypothetical protein